MHSWNNLQLWWCAIDGLEEKSSYSKTRQWQQNTVIYDLWHEFVMMENQNW
jgi:hypothetical protein